MIEHENLMIYSKEQEIANGIRQKVKEMQWLIL